MAKLLAQLVGESEARFSNQITRLEQGSGHPGVDVRLVEEIRQQLARKIKSLGLDVNDSTGAEIFWSLKHKALEDEALLRKSLKLKADNFELTLTKNADKLLKQKSWAVKRSVMKKILQRIPPAKAMKLLRYRSAASMLKNCELEDILFAAMLAEDEKWRNQLKDELGSLGVSDFEYRKVTVKTVKNKNLRDSLEPEVLKPAAAFDILGSVVVLPIKSSVFNDGSAYCLWLFAEIVRSYNRVRQSTAFLAFHQMHPNFGNVLKSWDKAYLDLSFHMGGTEISWERLVEAVNKPTAKKLSEALEPRLNAEDTELASTEVLLVHINVGLSWWLKTGYIGYVSKNAVVSFNITDVCCGTLLGVKGGVRTGLEHALSGELAVRYLLRPTYLAGLIEQLDNLEPPHQTKSVQRKAKAKRVG